MFGLGGLSFLSGVLAASVLELRGAGDEAWQSRSCCVSGLFFVQKEFWQMKTSKGTVVVPEELLAANEIEAREFFDSLSDGYRRRPS